MGGEKIQWFKDHKWHLAAVAAAIGGAVVNYESIYDLFFDTEKELFDKAQLAKLKSELDRLSYTGEFDFDLSQKDLLHASGGIDVYDKVEGGYQTKRLEIVWGANGTIEKLMEVKGSPALGTGFFIIEDADDGADTRWDLHHPAGERPQGAIQDYEVTKEYLEKRGAVTYDKLSDADKKKYDSVLRTAVSLADLAIDPATGEPRSGIPRTGDSPVLKEILRTGGFTDNSSGLTWKVLVDPKHGPFLVIDRDGDPSVPQMGDRKPNVHIWTSAKGVVLNPREY